MTFGGSSEKITPELTFATSLKIILKFDKKNQKKHLISSMVHSYDKSNSSEIDCRIQPQISHPQFHKTLAEQQ